MHRGLHDGPGRPAYDSETNHLRVHMANLRRKLEPGPSRPRYFVTEPGVGYRFVPDGFTADGLRPGDVMPGDVMPGGAG